MLAPRPTFNWPDSRKEWFVSGFIEWFFVVVLAAAFNITPLFAPPTAGLLAYFHINSEMGIIPLALVGGISAAAGRLALGLASRRFGHRLIPARRRETIERTVETLSQRRSAGITYLALFAFGPIPKGTLFVAAGMAKLPLLPGAIAFGVTRTGVYLGTLLVADTAATSLESLFGMSVVGPIGIAVQLLSLIAVFVFFRADWNRLAGRAESLKRVYAQVRTRFSPAQAAE